MDIGPSDYVLLSSRTTVAIHSRPPVSAVMLANPEPFMVLDCATFAYECILECTGLGR